MPFILIFIQNTGIDLGKENVLGWVISEAKNRSPFAGVISTILGDGSTQIPSLIYAVLFPVALYFITRKGASKTLTYFFVLAFLSSVFYAGTASLARFMVYPKIIYPIALASSIPNTGLLYAPMILSPIIQGTSINKIINPAQELWDIVTYDEISAFEFIRNTPVDSIFLIDGGSSGITEGHLGSHGDRIFPETSRRIFYYSGLMDTQEYQRRVDMYRRIAINPDDEVALDELRGYNVTHVYIGPTDVGLMADLFLESENYELLWRSGDVFIFKIK
jgi:hypothetical protein